MSATPVTSARPERVRSDYSELSRQIRDAGLMDRRPGWYLATIGTTVGVYAAGWAAFVVIGESWWQLVTAVFLGIATTQVAFLGHDAGHKQVFRTRRASYLMGLVHGNLLVGLSYGWWVDKHNRHHAHPNHEELDPDVSPDGPFLFIKGQIEKRSGLSRFLTRYQAWFFFPMLTLEGLALHAASIRALMDGTVSQRWREGTLLAVNLVAFVTVPFLVLTPLQAVAFIAVHQAVFGFYMGCSFAPNHKGMPPLTDEEEADYLRRQVLTSRNIRGGVVTDFALGGLNYQVEHHLFPSMPRPNLRHAQPLVAAFCAAKGVRYVETSAADSYGQVLKHLDDVGTPAAH
ncbi:acyl-CoA desaturase [Modestobacter sp. I12A-02628]|uniref:Acyl-CoA desaturase n=1 Tax=Goekera deserti TaxID=2497753 RepID=A0A7K3WJK0_9ACTN|nr:acyl-CoA desaturase [Goekera deserti]MPQ98205.1 acyl-CoA desaturase [Goekera deserti]NDI48855.1 acyl-CoA desaturase [Goekera deserti]NEL56536.1 acyl-CoA desaturase [Goekera deserti]